jgi:hypothetical protein
LSPNIRGGKADCCSGEKGAAGVGSGIEVHRKSGRD